MGFLARLSIVALAMTAAMTAALAAEIHVESADGVRVFADAFPHKGTGARGTIILFHQAGANAQEYATIAPHLAAIGFDAIAVDQRAGGGLFGGTNRTAAAFGRKAGYSEALPDMEAVLTYARSEHPGAKVLVWGSSYSASLVFVLTARHPGEVSAVLAFSPGEYFSTISVADAAAQVTVPVYVTSASDEGEAGAARAIADQVPGGLATRFVPKHGVHGSSTLRDDADPAGARENWAAVTHFLDRIAPALP